MCLRVYIHSSGISVFLLLLSDEMISTRNGWSGEVAGAKLDSLLVRNHHSSKYRIGASFHFCTFCLLCEICTETKINGHLKLGEYGRWRKSTITRSSHLEKRLVFVLTNSLRVVEVSCHLVITKMKRISHLISFRCYHISICKLSGNLLQQ